MPETNPTKLYDQDGDSWTQGEDGLWRLPLEYIDPDTLDPVGLDAVGFSKEYIERHWGPLTPEPQPPLRMANYYR